MTRLGIVGYGGRIHGMVTGPFRQVDPDLRVVAVVDPDYTEHNAGELLDSCNQVVHGLRELGLRHGDAVAVLLPNGAPFLEVLLAATQRCRLVGVAAPCISTCISARLEAPLDQGTPWTTHRSVRLAKALLLAAGLAGLALSRLGLTLGGRGRECSSGTSVGFCLLLRK